MNYRLNRKELRIIEQTKDQALQKGGSRVKIPIKEKVRPYIYFAAIFVAIAFGISLLLYFTA
ncbi:MAG: hypothetical protein LIO77_02585 [Rikenellaceae bacterium]|nr:hypothetical protein [Rikenellaceae bacterium]